MLDRQKAYTLYHTVYEYYKNYDIIKLNSKYSIRRLKNGILVISYKSGFVSLPSIIRSMFDDQKRLIPKHTEPRNLLKNWYEKYKKEETIEEEYYD